MVTTDKWANLDFDVASAAICKHWSQCVDGEIVHGYCSDGEVFSPHPDYKDCVPLHYSYSHPDLIPDSCVPAALDPCYPGGIPYSESYIEKNDELCLSYQPNIGYESIRLC